MSIRTKDRLFIILIMLVMVVAGAAGISLSSPPALFVGVDVPSQSSQDAQDSKLHNVSSLAAQGGNASGLANVSSLEKKHELRTAGPTPFPKFIANYFNNKTSFNVLILGDSIANGYKVGGDPVAWPRKLAIWLGQQKPEYTVKLWIPHQATGNFSGWSTVITLQSGTGTHTLRVYNASVTGAKITDWMTPANWNAMPALAAPADIIFGALAYNDWADPEDKQVSDLCQLAGQCRTTSPNAEILLMAQNPAKGNLDDILYRIALRATWALNAGNLGPVGFFDAYHEIILADPVSWFFLPEQAYLDPHMQAGGHDVVALQLRKYFNAAAPATTHPYNGAMPDVTYFVNYSAGAAPGGWAAGNDKNSGLTKRFPFKTTAMASGTIPGVIYSNYYICHAPVCHPPFFIGGKTPAGNVGVYALSDMTTMATGTKTADPASPFNNHTSYDILADSASTHTSGQYSIRNQSFCLISTASNKPGIPKPWGWEGFSVFSSCVNPRLLCLRGKYITAPATGARYYIRQPRSTITSSGTTTKLIEVGNLQQNVHIMGFKIVYTGSSNASYNVWIGSGATGSMDWNSMWSGANHYGTYIVAPAAFVYNANVNYTNGVADIISLGGHYDVVNSYFTKDLYDTDSADYDVAHSVSGNEFNGCRYTPSGATFRSKVFSNYWHGMSTAINLVMCRGIKLYGGNYITGYTSAGIQADDSSFRLNAGTPRTKIINDKVNPGIKMINNSTGYNTGTPTCVTFANGTSVAIRCDTSSVNVP